MTMKNPNGGTSNGEEPKQLLLRLNLNCEKEIVLLLETVLLEEYGSA